jgi:hypothetical protein
LRNSLGKLSGKKNLECPLRKMSKKVEREKKMIATKMTSTGKNKKHLMK